MSLKIINLDTPTLGDRSYIAHDGKTALVVDPQRDIDRVEEIIEAENLHIGAVVETHMHNDYVSGGLVLARKYGVKYVTSAQDPVSFDRQAVKDNEVINVGDFAIKAIHTPGHTFTHMAFILLTQENDAQSIFTGGSMLHGSSGRPDLLGWNNAATLAGLQHESIRRIVKLLEDKITIHPTHGFGSFCAATPTSGDSSTIADEKRNNPALLLDSESFISQTLAGLDTFPTYFKLMGAINCSGAGPIDISALKASSTEEVLKAIGAGVWTLDLRSRNSYIQGHIPGTLSFGLDGSFASYFGWIFPYEDTLILLSDRNEDIATAQRELVRIGIDRPIGAFVDNLKSITGLKKNREITFKDVAAGLKNPDFLILDTRSKGEWRTSHIQGTINIPFYELAARTTELRREKEIWVHCASGYRASVALGILETAGYRAVLVNDDYENSAHVAGLKIITGTADAGKPREP
ncbi:MAG: rhodanese-like domain-containing protein [Candidatus Planktophila sp.]|nr:rhodanese-like domain-containing protein [Candidatus Planktophila sp.]